MYHVAGERGGAAGQLRDGVDAHGPGRLGEAGQGEEGEPAAVIPRNDQCCYS